MKPNADEGFQPVAAPTEDKSWVYCDNITTNETRKLSEQYGLDFSIMRDVHDKYELPRVEYSDGNLYMFVRTAKQNSSGLVTTAPLLAILTTKQYMTLSTTSYFEPQATISQLTPMKSASGSGVVLGTLNANLISYEALIHQEGRCINDISFRLHSHEVENKDFIKFIMIEENLNTHQTNLAAIQVVLERLKENKHATFSDNQIGIIDDLLLHVYQLLVAISSHSQRVVSMRNTHTTIANNNLNQRIKTLTVLTVLIALPNVVFGMYGMNVSLPYMEQPWVYPAIITFTIFIVFIVYLIVRRKRIL